MKKGVFYMNLVKEKPVRSIYGSFEPKTTKYQDDEIRAYITKSVSEDLAEGLKGVTRGLETIIVRGFFNGR